MNRQRASFPAIIKQRQRVWVLLVVLGVAVASYAWNVLSRVDLPRPDLAGADHAVISAIEEAGSAVIQAPKSSQAWGELGIVLLIHGFRTEAELAFSRAESLDDAQPRWPYLRALAVVEERPEQAVAPLERAAALSADDPDIRGRLGETYLTLGDVAAAETHFQRLLEHHPEDARGRIGLAQIEIQRGEFDRATEHLAKLEDNPYCRKRALQLIAQIHRRQGNPAAAATTLAVSLPEDRPWPDPFAADAFDRQAGMFHNIERAKTLRLAGESARSSQLINQTEQQHPDLYWLLEGRLCLQKEELTAAEDALRKSLTISPEFIEARFWLGQVLLKAGKLEQAAAAFRHVLQLEISYAPAYLGLSVCLSQQQRQSAAVAELQNAIRYMPSSSEAQRELGRLLAEQGDLAKALVHLQQATMLDPNDAQAKDLLRQYQNQQQLP